MVNKILTGLTILIICSCNDQDQTSVPLIVPGSLEGRRTELVKYVNSARQNIRTFSNRFGWKKLAEEEFADRVMIFDDKRRFNINLLTIAGADTLMQLPETFCAALENRTLMAMTPEYYSRVYPEGIERNSYEKLLTHEMAHRLHIRILNGNEEAMGPIWFYEGFATYAANQFSRSKTELTKEEMISIMKDPERGSYVKYNYLFRYFVERVPLTELIARAGNDHFNEEMISMIK